MAPLGLREFLGSSESGCLAWAQHMLRWVASQQQLCSTMQLLGCTALLSTIFEQPLRTAAAAWRT